MDGKESEAEGEGNSRREEGKAGKAAKIPQGGSFSLHRIDLVNTFDSLVIPMLR